MAYARSIICRRDDRLLCWVDRLCRGLFSAGGGAAMNWEYLIIGLVALAVGVYLMVALLRPEQF